MKKYQIKIWRAVGMVYFFLTFFSFNGIAQPDPAPCGGDDPFVESCPLDTWVMLLAVIAVGYAVVHLYKKQKQQQIKR